MFDVWVMLSMHAVGGTHKKTIETMLMRKVIAGHITATLLRRSVLVRIQSDLESLQSPKKTSKFMKK